MAKTSGITSKKAEYALSYEAMRGVDLSTDGSNIERYRYAYLENMYRDYNGDGCVLIESVPGFRRIAALKKKIHRIYLQRIGENEDYVVLHAGDSLYRFNLADKDSIDALSPIGSIRDSDSRGFCCGGELYILDGESITRISGDGVAEKVSDSGAEPYVPTTYVNGVEYEQRNLLTNRFYESFLISATDTVTYGSHELYYRINDAQNKLASVTGIASDFSGTVYLPSYVRIGGESYKVTEIADNAFSANNKINAVKISEGILRIGKNAFANCASLTSVRCARSTEEIDNCAFQNCKLLEEMYIGANMKRLGNDSFYGCSSLEAIKYALDTESFSEIENHAAIEERIVYTARTDFSLTVDIPLHTPTKSISAVTADGEFIAHSPVYGKDALIESILISVKDGRALEGKEILISGVADASRYSKSSAGTDFLSNSLYSGTAMDAILGCKICETFDGRIFLSGNPELPNTVFYSGRDGSGNNNPLYYGVLNYFNDGVGAYPVISMLAAGDSLAVFKSGDDGGGSIFYHQPAETGVDIIPKIYPVSYVHGGIDALGESISFFDDPVFISQNGLSALEKKTLNLERSVACRSHNVNSYLLREDLKKATLAKWQGYLVVLAGGNTYLADSRATFTHPTGFKEYEWYYLTNIGTFKDSNRIFRYSPTAHSGYFVHEKPDERTEALIYSTVQDGATIFYTQEDGKKYEVYQSQECEGGIFSPAVSIMCVDDEILFFGTDSGDLCVFNNDKRGIAPPRIASDPDYNEEEYRRLYGRRIHPEYYSFHDHAVRYALKTVKDDCSVPHLAKNTVKHSLVIKCKVGGSGSLICEVGTDRSGYSEIARIPASEIGFYDLDFSSMILSASDEGASLPINEKEKGWVEKQIAVYSDAFCAPFGIYSITYRFIVKGRIKNN